MNAPLYTPAILRLATAIPHFGRLPPPATTVERRSPVCGSVVCASVRLGPDRRIIVFAQDVAACALGQASAAILGKAVIGMDAATLGAAHDALAGWLKGAGPLPAALARDFPDLSLFEAARAYPARHPSILLAFAAAHAAARATDGNP